MLIVRAFILTAITGPKFNCLVQYYYNDRSEKTQATRSGVDTPVDDVEEKIRHWKDDSGVRVNHVAVAHYESDVFAD